jgi:DMSO/TMAO reductase YedYZ molybdopterin-dependent catalytic subunit
MTTPNSPPADPDLPKQLRRMTRRGFAWGAGVLLTGYGAWRWVKSAPTEGMLQSPLRRILELDEKLGRATFDPNKRSRSFPASWARMPRVNGRYGVDEKLDQAAWRLRVEGPSGSKSYTIEQVKALPRTEYTTELKCVEGWSEVVTWAGARLADLAALDGLAFRDGKGPDLLPYVELKTPDSKYYVGLDVASAMHPQTLLCYEMNGAPLTPSHGAPLRLAIPIKYGIKNLKQIGTIRFSEARPADFWADRGYDWYAGL